MLNGVMPLTPRAATAEPAGGREPRFWRRAGAVWRQLAGGVAHDGFSFEWQEIAPAVPLNWAHSFHPSSVEICLNLQGTAWAASRGARLELGPESAAFFVLNGGRLRAQRPAGQRHQFLSVEFSLAFLRLRLQPHAPHLHRLIQRGLAGPAPMAGFSNATPLNHRHRDLLKSLLHPPVLASAQRLWYESKALEFAAEFFFSAGEAEPLCTRAQRLAAERVTRAKAILLENLVEPPTLEELGRRVACSHFYLSRTFTRETGLTISQWLRRARLERAADLLRARKCNVTEAALEVGYSSLSHFSQAFHEMFGCCPGLYPLRTPAQKAASSELALEA
jgi:AraC-like DNA-binding protein